MNQNFNNFPPSFLPEKIDVFQFDSVGSLIKKYVELKRMRHPMYSFRLLAKKLNLKSPSQLTMIVREEREPTQSFINRLADHLGFSEKEHFYLNAVTGFRKSQLDKDKEYYAALIERFHAKSDELILRMAEIKMMRNWYTVAILAMADLGCFDGSAQSVAAKLGDEVSLAQVEEAISVLVQLKLLVKNKVGRLVKSADHIKTPMELPSDIIQEHHQTMCDKAKVAIKEQAIADRYFSSSMLSVPAHKIDLAKQLMAEFSEKFIEQVSVGPGDDVYHLGMQFFKITKY